MVNVNIQVSSSMELPFGEYTHTHAHTFVFTKLAQWFSECGSCSLSVQRLEQTQTPEICWFTTDPCRETPAPFVRGFLTQV